jgi:hypothetical protein
VQGFELSLGVVVSIVLGCCAAGGLNGRTGGVVDRAERVFLRVPDWAVGRIRAIHLLGRGDVVQMCCWKQLWTNKWACQG